MKKEPSYPGILVLLIVLIITSSIAILSPRPNAYYCRTYYDYTLELVTHSITMQKGKNQSIHDVDLRVKATSKNEKDAIQCQRCINEEFHDPVIRIEIQNPSIADYQDGVILPKEKGKTKIIVYLQAKVKGNSKCLPPGFHDEVELIVE